MHLRMRRFSLRIIAFVSGQPLSDSCAGISTSKPVKRVLSQLFVKCNINYSPADLPPRLLRRYAQVVSVRTTLSCCYGQRNPGRKKAENAARITNSLLMGQLFRGFPPRPEMTERPNNQVRKIGES